MQKELKNKRSLLIPYITAGFPKTNLFVPILEALSRNGATYIEVGVPHSDPLADGPTIQHSSKIAIENGVNLNWIIQTLKNIPEKRKKKIKPLILFSYLNPLLSYGFKKLLADLPKDLFYGLIIPDLQLEEAAKYNKYFKKHKLNLILLVAPTTKEDRLRKIAKASSGFIYLVSVTGVTGERRNFSIDLKNKIKELKLLTTKPVAVGFGISNLSQAKEVISMGADGIVIGSALIKTLSNGKNNIKSIEKFLKKFT